MKFRTVTSMLVATVMVAVHGILPAAAAGVKDGAKPVPAAARPAPVPSRSGAGSLGSMPGGVTLPGVPLWTPPEQYSVDMVMTTGKQGITMHRAIQGANIRSEIESEGNKIVMLERADEPGITYNLMPSEKMAMRMNVAKMSERAVKDAKQLDTPPESEVTPVIEKVGTETIDGRAATKFKVSAEGRTALMWFETASGAPLRMEVEEARIEWKNLEVKPQPAKLFEVPKDYQLIDMEEQMKQMEKMRGSMGGAALGGMAGMAGMGGGLSLEGMAGSYGGQMGSNLGQQVGSGIGASFGGPIGAMAGSYIGGKVGGWIGKRAATAVTPDIGPGSKK